MIINSDSLFATRLNLIFFDFLNLPEFDDLVFGISEEESSRFASVSRVRGWRTGFGGAVRR